MALKDDLVTARSYIVFVLGLLVAFSLVYYIESNSKLPEKQVIPPVMMVKSVVKLPHNQLPAEPVVVDSERAIDQAVINQPVPVVAVKPPVTSPVAATATAPVQQDIVPPIQAQQHSTQMAADNAMQPKIPDDIVASTLTVAKRKPRALTIEEMEWARIAWQYFANNTQATGLVNSVNGYHATTMWDTASYMMAAISAQRLGIIEKEELNERMAKLLSALEAMPLFEGQLPNKSYNTKTLAMVNYANKETAQGIGWSAIDIGRLLVPLKILKDKYPQHRASIKKVLARWKTDNMLKNGLLFGGSFATDGSLLLLQEGRLGYEQYAAKTFSLFNWPASAAASYTNYLQYVTIEDMKIAVDKRDPKKSGAYNYMLSEPYFLDGLEFGFDRNSAQLAEKLFLVQEKRFKRTGIVTAVSEDHIDVSPYFVYNTVYVAGQAWAAITDKGADASAYRSLSTKTAFAWYALYQHPYSADLIKSVKNLYQLDQGWFAGLYEQGKRPNKVITENTNAIVLESLAYIKTGKLLP